MHWRFVEFSLWVSATLGCGSAPCPACPPPYVEPLTESPVTERCDRVPTEADLQADRDDWQEAMRLIDDLAPSTPGIHLLQAARAAYAYDDFHACNTHRHAVYELDESSAPALLIGAACNQRLGQLSLARAELRSLLARADAAGSSWEPLVRRWQERLAAHIPKVTFRLEGPYRPDTLWVSYRPVPPDSAAREFSVDPGRQLVRAVREAPHAETQREIELKMGCTSTVPLRLERAISLCMTPEENECAERMRRSRSAGEACERRLQKCKQRCAAAGRPF